MPIVGAATHQTLSDLSVGKPDILEEALGVRELDRDASGLDPRTFALVKIAALIAVDAPPASYAWQLGNALAIAGDRSDANLLALRCISRAYDRRDLSDRNLTARHIERTSQALQPAAQKGHSLHPPTAEVSCG